MKMIDTATLFILGAGASSPYGYPTGKELRKYIIKQLPSSIGNYICHSENPQIQDRKEVLMNKLDVFTDVFFKSSTQSIDLFLSRNPSYEHIGKISIIASILEKEKESGLHEDSFSPGRDWYSYLYHRMTNTLIRPENYQLYKKNKVSFITFNYDRSLEQFFYESLTNSFKDEIGNRGLSKDEILPFEVVHVYGKTVPLIWQSSDGLEYKSDLKLEVESYTENIRVIYDRADEGEIEKAANLIKKAERIFFLGFGYAKENLEVLDLPNILDRKQKLYGTAIGMTEREISRIENLIWRVMARDKPEIRDRYSLLKNKVKIENVDCLELIQTYL